MNTNEIEIFRFHTAEVRTDATRLLGYTHTPSAIRRLDDDEYTQTVLPQVAANVRRPGPPPRPVTVVNESGLYSLILWSEKPEATTFRRWLTHEVLPTIRKTGAYIAPGSQAALDVTTNPDNALETIKAAAAVAQAARSKATGPEISQ